MSSSVTKKRLKDLYVNMLTIRLSEQKIADLALANEIKCPIHLYVGQEAIAAGVCRNLRNDDYVFSTHRGHGHYIAKGGDLNSLFAEILGKSTGCSKGKGGSMHLIAYDQGFLGSTPTVGSSISNAVGSALACKLANKKQVAVAFLGDGAVEEGVFYESINFASLYFLPVIFVCENNLFATHMPLSLRQKNQNIFEKVSAHKVKSLRIFGNDAIQVWRESKKLIEYSRKGNGPCFIEAMTYRWLAHVGPWEDLDIGFRTKQEVFKWRNRCPINSIKSVLINKYFFSQTQFDIIENEVRDKIQEAYEFAKGSPYPLASELTTNVFS